MEYFSDMRNDEKLWFETIWSWEGIILSNESKIKKRRIYIRLFYCAVIKKEIKGSNKKKQPWTHNEDKREVG